MTLPRVSTIRWLLSALLVAGAALFAIGVTIERGSDDHHDETEAVEHEEAEGSEAHEAEEAEEASSEHDEAEEEERVLGLDVESPALVAVGVVVSLALAVLAWRTRSRAAFGAIAAFAALFAVFDVAELAHQLDESRTGLALYVVVVALVHIAAAIVGVLSAREPQTT